MNDKRNVMLILVVLLLLIPEMNAQRNISIFSDHIESVASQEQISFQEAAERIRQLGYNGVDVWVTMDDEKQRILDNLGFQHASAIAYIDFAQDDKQQEIDYALDFMHRQNYKRLLLVPGLLPANADEKLIDQVYARTKAFMYQAQAEGVDVMIEDYDNILSPTYDMAALDRFFKAVPCLSHVFDTGNYLYAADDVMTALHHFRSRIHHVHLKDRKAIHDNASPALGTGIIPLKEFVVGLLKSGYDGWFTVEHFDSPQMMAYAKTSIANLQAVWDEFDRLYPSQAVMAPEITEQWIPQPLIVKPCDNIGLSAPSDAIVLFDGNNLNQWCSENGGNAEWNIHDGVLTVDKTKGDIMTRQLFGSFQLHLEWQVPKDISGNGQARGNSGVFLANRYEIQILDSYQNETYANGQAGSIYKQKAPLVNAMRAPGEWNSYDIIFNAPVFDDEGKMLLFPCVTVLHNGVVIQNNSKIIGTTEWIGFPRKEKHGDAPIRLQAHGDPSFPVSFRNIWVRNL